MSQPRKHKKHKDREDNANKHIGHLLIGNLRRRLQSGVKGGKKKDLFGTYRNRQFYD